MSGLALCFFARTGLRIINGSHDLTYAEYTQEADLYHFEHVYFKELYDLSK